MPRFPSIDDQGGFVGDTLAWADARFATGGFEQNAALAGADLYAYGHSYIQGAGVSDPLTKWTSIFQRDYMNARVQFNRGVSGHTMEQTLTEIVSNATRKWVPGDQGLVVLQSVLNNVLRTNAGNSDMTTTSFRNALTTAIRVLRSGAYIPNTDSSVTYTTGTWGTMSWSTSRSGSLRSSGTGSELTISGYSDTEIGLMVWAGKLPTSIEARYEVLVNGVKHGDTLDVSNKWSNESDVLPSAGQPMFCEWITGLPAGSKTITIRVVNASNDQSKTLYFDGYLRPNPAPPTVLVVKDTPILNYQGAALGNADSDLLLARLNRVIDDVVASYNRPGEIVAADAGIGFNPSTMLGGTTGSDNLHPNTAGHAAIAKAVNRAALNLPYRQSMFV